MSEDGNARGGAALRTASDVRGWLSEQLVPALLDARGDELGKRFGPRGVLDDAIGGRGAGLVGVGSALERLGRALVGLGARWEPLRFTWGTERDVTEGVLRLPEALGGGLVPFAAVAERRRGREIEVRTHYDPRRLGEAPLSRRAATATPSQAPLPPQVQVLVDALRRGDPSSADVVFERHARCALADGSDTRGRDELGRALLAAFPRPCRIEPTSVTDDGRATVVEAVTALGDGVPPESVLLVCERADSGLFRELALYGRVG